MVKIPNSTVCCLTAHARHLTTGAGGTTNRAATCPGSPHNPHEPWRPELLFVVQLLQPWVVFSTEHIPMYDLNENIGFPRLLPCLMKPQCPFQFVFDSSLHVSLHCASQGARICLNSLSVWSRWVPSAVWEKLSVSAPTEGNRCWRCSTLFLIFLAPSTLK